MDDQAQRSALLSALTTEHFVLQTANNSTYAEASARSTLYVMVLSSALVAMGFIGGSSDVLIPFAAIVLPALFVLGIFTVVRLVETVLESQRCLIGIARIRGYYRTLGPDAAAHFAPQTGRWPEARTSPALAHGEFIAFLGTSASMVAFIDSVVAGAGVTLLAADLRVGGRAVPSLALGVAVVPALMAAFLAYQRWRFASAPATGARGPS